MNHQQHIASQFQSQLDEHRWAFEKVLYFIFPSGFGSGLTNHGCPAQQQAVTVACHAAGQVSGSK